MLHTFRKNLCFSTYVFTDFSLAAPIVLVFLSPDYSEIGSALEKENLDKSAGEGGDEISPSASDGTVQSSHFGHLFPGGTFLFYKKLALSLGLKIL